jgi:hypothetical protein
VVIARQTLANYAKERAQTAPEGRQRPGYVKER